MPSIEEILKKSESLDQILDEDNIVNSVKQSGCKFADFLFRNPAYLKQLIDYVI